MFSVGQGRALLSIATAAQHVRGGQDHRPSAGRRPRTPRVAGLGYVGMLAVPAVIGWLTARCSWWSVRVVLVAPVAGRHPVCPLEHIAEVGGVHEPPPSADRGDGP